MANVVYNNFKTASLSGQINFASDVIKVMLISGSYTPNIDTHIVTGDVGLFETTGIGYSKGGVQLGTVTVTTDTTDDEGVFDAADSVWSSATFSASGAVIYKSGTTAANSWLIGYVDFGAANSVTNGTFTIQWNSEGIINAN